MGVIVGERGTNNDIDSNAWMMKMVPGYCSREKNCRGYSARRDGNTWTCMQLPSASSIWNPIHKPNLTFLVISPPLATCMAICHCSHHSFALLFEFCSSLSWPLGFNHVKLAAVHINNVADWLCPSSHLCSTYRILHLHPLFAEGYMYM